MAGKIYLLRAYLSYFQSICVYLLCVTFSSPLYATVPNYHIAHSTTQNTHSTTQNIHTSTSNSLLSSTKNSCPFQTHVHSFISTKANATQKHRDTYKARKCIRSLLEDALELHKNIFTWQSFRITTTILPFFAGARMIDKRFQNCFYDAINHKNKWSLSRKCPPVVEWGVAVPLALLGSQWLFGKTEKMRNTSRIFVIGLPFLYLSKCLLKSIECNASLRPWNGNFSRTKRPCGGFPSGHTAKTTYATVLYGLQYGPRFTIPLGTLTLVVGAAFIACNRHYTSQVVAGVGLGAIYGFAASKLVDSKLNDCITMGATINNNGPALSVTYQF